MKPTSRRTFIQFYCASSIMKRKIFCPGHSCDMAHVVFGNCCCSSRGWVGVHHCTRLDIFVMGNNIWVFFLFLSLSLSSFLIELSKINSSSNGSDLTFCHGSYQVKLFGLEDKRQKRKEKRSIGLFFIVFSLISNTWMRRDLDCP